MTNLLTPAKIYNSDKTNTKSPGIRVLGLEKFDWSLPNESSIGHITSLHPYPARFIPSIPKELLSKTLRDKKRQINILDPFAGCGTTLVVGLEEGHNVIGIDVNHLAVLLQRVYTYPFTKTDLNFFQDLIARINGSVNKLAISRGTEIPNIEHWFSDMSRRSISSAINLINGSNYPEHIKDLARLSLSRVLVKLSNQKSDTQYVAVKKRLSISFIKNTIIGSLLHVYETYKNRPIIWQSKAKIILGDAREPATFRNLRGVDLVITSPPYPNAYEYWLYHKYRMYWLGLDPLWSREKEIGARPYYSGNGKLDEWDFQRDVCAVLKNIYRVTRREAVQFWVVGDSIIKGRKVDNSKIVENACKRTGWRLVNTLERNINRRRSSFQGIGRQKSEAILVIKKR